MLLFFCSLKSVKREKNDESSTTTIIDLEEKKRIVAGVFDD
jgi:hypothetical protein